MATRSSAARCVTPSIVRTQRSSSAPFSAFEPRTKRRIGKLHGLDELIDNLSALLVEYGFSILAISLAHAELGGSLPIPHRDPFDRLLIAQAQIEDAWLVSNEKPFDDFGVRRLW